MNFDYSKLLGKIKEKFGTQGKFAIAMGVGLSSLNQKLNNKAEFSQNEMDRACELLGIGKEKLSTYFFTLEVQKIELVTERMA